MTETSTTTKPLVSAYPFSPLTLDGLGILIEENASVVVHAINTGRAHEGRFRVRSQLVLDLCRARTDRALALVIQIRGAA